METPETGVAALERIVFFSDAVFAIAITLLVLVRNSLRDRSNRASCARNGTAHS